jgi:hypothetical protein
MSQLTYNATPNEAYAGMPYDSSLKRDVISRINAAKQLWQVVVTTADDSQDFTVTLNGVAHTFTSDASATKAEISAGLKAEIDAGSVDVTVDDDLTDTLLIENNSYDNEVTCTVTAGGSGALTATELIDHEDAIHFGAVVVDDPTAATGLVGAVADAQTGKRDTCRLPRLATDFSNRKMLGVAMADTTLVTRAAVPRGGYNAGETVPVWRTGRIWMYVEDVASVVTGGLVYVRHVATGTERLGDIRAVDDGSDTEVLDAQQAQFTGQKITSLNLAVVEWNLP